MNFEQEAKKAQQVAFLLDDTGLDIFDMYSTPLLKAILSGDEKEAKGILNDIYDRFEEAHGEVTWLNKEAERELKAAISAYRAVK